TLTVIAPASLPLPIRVNAGGGVYTDSLNQSWIADAGYQSGSVFSISGAISGTLDPSLYRAVRYSANWPLTSLFAVPNGSYSVKLKFAELYYTATNQRVFDINVNGATQSHFDAVAAAPGAFKAIDQTFAVTVNNGLINIALNPVIENPA